MGKIYEELSEEHQQWIAEQPMFFVATASTASESHVNVSPKGYDTFRIFDPRSVGYLDLTGSGVETIAHIRENGRITIMFCGFTGRPRILRLYGTARVVRAGDEEFAERLAGFEELSGTRSLILVDLEMVRSSCGFSVPEMTLVGERSTLKDWSEKKGPEGIEAYWQKMNATSLDGLAGL
jgi:predicted pyridoxine 5'-phosphate oxidase superfamily flavin-nucleotide-binding protein